MPENTNKQRPATLNQIENTKPAIPRSFNRLEGDIAGTMNAGHYRTIALKEVMASEKIAIEGAQMYIQLQTPKTPAYQKLKAVVRAYMVPHQRVWNNYYKFKAQNGGASIEKIQTMPNFAGKEFPISVYQEEKNTYLVSFQETTKWRDSFASCYMPRVGAGVMIDREMSVQPFNLAPPINALAIRGWVAIWNDEIRNKEYDEERTEYTEDTVSQAEWDSYFWTKDNDADFYTARARRNNSYYTNYRTELQGYDLQPNEIENQNEYALNWASFESKFNETRTQAEQAQMNPWDVAQQLSGGKKLTEGRVQLISTREFPINYSAITQNAYNNNTEIEEKYRVMGMQGAYSYTEIDLSFLNGIEVVEDGYIHIVMCITADTVFESGIERQFLNINWDDRYRPDMKDDKLDIMYECEYGTPDAVLTINNDTYSRVVGFKRKYTENFKLPTMLNGEVYNRGYYQSTLSGQEITQGTRIIPNNTYQFFEFAGNKFQSSENLSVSNKKIWLDYTDVMLNKNLAVKQEMYTADVDKIMWRGPNQIVYFGKHYCLTDMPIAEEIKNNYTKWGEH